MFGVVFDYYDLKLKGTQLNTSPKHYQTEIRIIANPGLKLNQVLNNPALISWTIFYIFLPR